ncbi:flagellar motor switch protein FliM [Limnochorda pilosa]|uniref:Flagellar motor switch protein FliM n=1 Tax=Limnochorda pilosa TaxID=1555112 RepID=A0A0K2SPN9_LIMPI|nr:FliM/FliN family flagellar motor switch protein [Limnochorda pilosa]BAS28789.1 flagellar motor switch protein FliM [Limnochorda pilosa]
MERNLSQHEIDALINQLRSGELEEEEESLAGVTRYDFRRADRISREQMRALERVVQSWGRSVAGFLATHTRQEVQLQLTALQQLPFGEFRRSLPNPSVLTVYTLKPVEGSMVLQLEPGVTLALYERLCGGPGDRGEDRELTDVEMSVLRRQLFAEMGRRMEAAWKEFLPLEVAFSRVETNPVYLNLLYDQDTALVGTFQLGLEDRAENLSLGLAFDDLDQLLSHLSAEFVLKSRRQPTAKEQTAWARHLGQVTAPVEAILGRAEVTLAELVELAAGDVVPLQTGPEGTIEIVVGTRTKFRGTPGRVGNHTAVLITGPARQGASRHAG